jgi:hypothetical protein
MKNREIERMITMIGKATIQRLRGALLVGGGFALTQALLLLRKPSMNVASLVEPSLSINSFVHLVPEALTISFCVFLFLVAHKRRTESLIISTIVGSVYLVGMIALTVGINALAIWTDITPGSVWVLAWIIGLFLVGFLMGTAIYAPLVGAKSLKSLALLGGALSTSQVSAYLLFLLVMILSGSSISSPWYHPQFLYALVISGLGKGLVIGFALGHITQAREETNKEGAALAIS